MRYFVVIGFVVVISPRTSEVTLNNLDTIGR